MFFSSFYFITFYFPDTTLSLVPDYDSFRKNKSVIKIIKDYYRSQLKEGEELWWIDQDSEEKPASPIIKPFRNLNSEEKESFIIEAMILFPEMFGSGNQKKFERAAAYLITEYNAVSSCFRDIFTAGGREKITIEKKVVLPRILYNLRLRLESIKSTINNIDLKKIKFYWRSDNVEEDRLHQWKKILDEKLSTTKLKITVSDIFDSELL